MLVKKVNSMTVIERQWVTTLNAHPILSSMDVILSSSDTAQPISDARAINARVPLKVAEEMALIRAAADLTRELSTANPAIYWADFLVSAVIGYGALFLCVTTGLPWVFALSAVIAMLALYRASSFIHELTHMKSTSVPGFRVGWNMLVGIPMMIPSFLYEGTHNQHHNKTRYGTADDPEYLPLALMKPYTLLLFLIVAMLAPIGFLIRYAVLAPLSLAIPPLRRHVVAAYSTLAINPGYRRRPPEGSFKRDWIIMETATSIWAIALLASIWFGFVPLRVFLIFLGLISGAMLINQVRTLVAHLWENDGDVMSITAQYLDSVNVPPPSTLPALWAPVGLRYHAIHHLLPSVPYHALGKAHRRLVAAMPAESAYHRGNYNGLSGLVAKLVRGTLSANDR
jgi:fatty acid desaturase